MGPYYIRRTTVRPEATLLQEIYFSTADLILVRAIVESTFLIEFSNVTGRRFCGGPFGFIGLGSATGSIVDV